MLVVRQHASEMDWTMVMLTPVDAVMEGISVLRTAIIVSAAIGTVLFLVLACSCPRTSRGRFST